MAMGDGEVALTAMEGAVRATFRLTVCRKGSGDAPSVAFGYPFAETPEAWVPIGLSDPDGAQGGQVDDLDIAMRRAVVNALDFLSTTSASTVRSRTRTCPRPPTSASPRSSTVRPACARRSRRRTSPAGRAG